jgi:hypothetical protein
LLIELNDNGSGVVYQAGRKVELSAVDIRCIEYFEPAAVDADIVEKPGIRQRKPESFEGWQATVGHVLHRAPGLVRCAAREVGVSDEIADQLAAELSTDWQAPVRTRTRCLPAALVEARAAARASRMAAKAQVKAERLALTPQRQAEKQAARTAILGRKAARTAAKAAKRQAIAGRQAAAAAARAAAAAARAGQSRRGKRDAAVNSAIDLQLKLAWARASQPEPTLVERERELVAA